MNTKRKGSLAVGSAINYYTNIGVSVFIPLSDNDLYDLIIDQNGLKKVQCKYSDNKEQNGGYNIDLRTFTGYKSKSSFKKYKFGDFDLLFIYCSNGNRYLMPAEKIISKSHLVVGSRKWNEYIC